MQCGIGNILNSYVGLHCEAGIYAEKLKDELKHKDINVLIAGRDREKEYYNVGKMFGLTMMRVVANNGDRTERKK